MDKPVTAQFLLQGAVYAVHQSGILLRDANILFRNESYANAVVLAAYSQEEAGLGRMLLQYRDDVLKGEVKTYREIKGQTEDHAVKHKSGMSYTFLSADPDSGLGKMMKLAQENTPEGKSASKSLQEIILKKTKSQPEKRHEQRQESLYVSSDDGTSWNVPSQVTSKAKAQQYLTEAANDYANILMWLHPPFMAGDDAMIDELKELKDVPKFLWPEAP